MLGVELGATNQELTKAYRKLALTLRGAAVSFDQCNEVDPHNESIENFLQQITQLHRNEK